MQVAAQRLPDEDSSGTHRGDRAGTGGTRAGLGAVLGVLALHAAGPYLPWQVAHGIDGARWMRGPHLAWFAVAALAVVIPSARRAVADAILRLDSAAATRAGRALLAGGTLAVLALLRDRIVGVGDFANLQPISGADLGLDWAHPLDRLAHVAVESGLQAVAGPHDPALSYVLLSIGAGLVWVFAAIRLAAALEVARAARCLVVVSVVTSGTSALFFGHVEAYSLLNAALLVALGALVRVARGPSSGRSAFVAGASLGVAAACHGSGLWLATALPAVGMLAWRRGERTAPLLLGLGWLLPIVATAATLVALGSVMGGGLRDVWNISMRDGHFFVPAFTPSDPGDTKVFFSGTHLADTLNLLVLLAPGALPAAWIAVSGTRRTASFDPAVAALASASVGALLFLLLWMPGFGLELDWDLFAIAGTTMAPLAAVIALSRRADPRDLLGAWTVLGCATTAPWIVGRALALHF